MIHWLFRLAIVSVFVVLYTQSFAQFSDPVKLFPPCKGGEFGRLMPVVRAADDGKKYVYVVLINHEVPAEMEYIDPANIICWPTKHQKVAVMPLDQQAAYGPIPALRK